MANAFTGTAAMANLVQTTYDRALEFALRAQPMFRQVADKRPVQQAMPGSSVVFELYADLAPATAALNELVDPDAVAAGNPTTVSVTLNEYGNAILVSNKLDLFSFTDVTAGLVNQVAWNLVDSVDVIVQTVLATGTQTVRRNGSTNTALTAPLYNTGTFNAVDQYDVYGSDMVRMSVAKLRAQFVHPNKGTFYTTYIHPEVSIDLRAETGNSGWRVPMTYSSADNIWAGEIGEYEGSVFIETPRAINALNTAATPVRVFNTYTMGQQALAEAVAEEFHTIRGPVVDKLTRYQPLGWYGVAGWSLYRPQSLIINQTTSSIHNLT